MRVYFDEREKKASIICEVLEDLWHLEKIIEKRDLVEAKTTRVFKINNKEEKKNVKIKIEVERVEFAKFSNLLRIGGKIISGSPEEYVQKGRYHTLEIGINDKVEIFKDEWKNYHLKRLKEAEAEAKLPIAKVIAFDDEMALVAFIRGFGITVEKEIYSYISKKEKNFEEKKAKYYENLLKEIEEEKVKVILASTSFELENFRKFINEKNKEILNRVIFETVISTHFGAIRELLRKGLLEKMKMLSRVEKEQKAIDSFLIHINKDDGYAIYGIEEVKKSLEVGSLEKLLVLDTLLRNNKEVEEIVEKAEKIGEIIIFSSETEYGELLKNIGGIGAILRFKV